MEMEMENMQPRKRRAARKRTAGAIVIALLTVTTIISTALAVTFGMRYMQSNARNAELEAQIVQSELSVPVISDSVEDLEAESATEESVEVMGESQGDEDISVLLQAKEDELEASIKERMKELVTAEDGSPLKMLRSFFPENLIYADNDEYVFAPVLDEVDKHSLLAENFVETDDGEMQYVADGEVISHKGIDVSKYQGDIDWEAVASDGVEYAFVRLGIRGYESGKLVLDEYFDQNMRGADDAGISAGVYFFTQAVTVEEAIEEAEFVLENMADYNVTYPVVFDVEMIVNSNGRANNLSQEERTEIAIAFCDAIKAAGYTPMIYGNIKCFTKLLDMTRLNDYEKWYAFYDDYMYMPYDVGIWQYTENGRVAGISTSVDLNISYKQY
ncbi:MAG: glycoside hydrolase family 25 protein [Lachnospiraceae bacterium]|nr:glycoside hydrolase family 25 protein [Lachnospiraceae bacterium]